MIDLRNPLSILLLNPSRCGYVRHLESPRGGKMTDRLTLTQQLPFPLPFLVEDIVGVQVAISMFKLMKTEVVGGSKVCL